MIKSVKKLLSLVSILFLAQATLYAPNQGLENQNGNDCFFSASFQCLSQIKPLIDFLTNNPEFRTPTGPIVARQPTGPGIIQKKFYAFIQAMKTNPRLTAAFRTFITSRAATNDFFLRQMATEQRDAHEFLSFLLQYLIGQTPYHAEITKQLEAILTTKVPAATTRARMIDRIMEILNTDMQKIASLREHLRYVIQTQPANAALLSSTPLEGNDAAWAICDAQIKKLQELYSIFDTELLSTVTCTICGYFSVRSDVARALLVKIPDIKKPTIQNCIDLFKSQDTLSGGNQWLCERCGKKVDAKKQFSFGLLPKILIVSLKRFRAGGDLGEKIDTPVAFPLQLPINVKAQTLNFNLFGIVCHGGGTGGGHYWAYTKDMQADRMSRKREWYKYDDATRTGPLDEKTTILNLGKARDPYIFFYELDAGDEKTRDALVDEPETPEPDLDIKPPVVSVSNIETEVTEPLTSLQDIVTFCKSLEAPIDSFNTILQNIEKFQLQALKIFGYDEGKYGKAPTTAFKDFFAGLRNNNFTWNEKKLKTLTFETISEIDVKNGFLRSIYDSTIEKLTKLPQIPLLKLKTGLEDSTNALLCYSFTSDIIKFYTIFLSLLPDDLDTLLTKFMEQKDALLSPATQTKSMAEIGKSVSDLCATSKRLVDLTQSVANISSLLEELKAPVTTFNIKNITTLVEAIKKSAPAKPEELLQKSLQDLNTQFLVLKDALSKINSKPVPTIKSKTPSKK